MEANAAVCWKDTVFPISQLLLEEGGVKSSPQSSQTSPSSVMLLLLSSLCVLTDVEYSDAWHRDQTSLNKLELDCLTEIFKLFLV